MYKKLKIVSNSMTAKRKYLRNMMQLFAMVFIAILLAVVLRVFLFSTFKIPSPSMSPALQSGDFIIVNKLVPGPRIFKSFDFIRTDSKPRFWRLKGMRSVKRNDVLVFNFPYSERGKIGLDIDTYYVKRCVAIPGDTFFIDNGIYRVKGCRDTLGSLANQKWLSNSSEFEYDAEVFRTFPKKSFFDWNLKNFGPLYVPRKGDCVDIDAMNISLYKTLIEYESEKGIHVKDEQVYLNDSCITAYTFRINYYFMAGDLVRDSQDSRYWGLLPEDHIVGKASIIWKSEDTNTGKIRWDRVMKFIK